MNKRNEYALITGGTSGIGQATIPIFQKRDIPIIITGSRDPNLVQKDNGVIYIQHDLSSETNFSEKIKYILQENNAKISYIFLNAGKVCDETKAKEIQEMQIINGESNKQLIQDLLSAGNIDTKTRIVINSSIQALIPREDTPIYAESKRNLAIDMLNIAKEIGLDISIIGPSAIENTPMLEKLITIHADKYFDGDKQRALEDIRGQIKAKPVTLNQVINILEDLFFSNTLLHKVFQKGKFFPIDNTKGHQQKTKLPISYQTNIGEKTKSRQTYAIIALFLGIMYGPLEYKAIKPEKLSHQEKIELDMILSGMANL